MRGVRFSQQLIDEYVAKGYWNEITMVDIFEEDAKNYPYKEAVVDSNRRLTWLEVKQYSDRLAVKFLELGIERDQIIVVQLLNTVDAFVLQVAFRKAGVVNAQAIPVFRHKEMGYVLESLEAVGVVIPWRQRNFDYFQMIQDLKPNLPKLKYIFISGNKVPPGGIAINEIYQQPLEEKYTADVLENHKINAFDTSIILLTSGSTGIPKMVEWPEASCIVGGKGILEKTMAAGEDIFGGIMPMSGASGYLSIWLAPPQVAAKTVILDIWDPGAALELIEREKITILIAAPPQMEKIFHHPNFNKTDLSSLRVIRSGGGPLVPSKGVQLERAIGCKVIVSSGCTETGVFGCTHVDDPDHIRLFTLGKPIKGMEVKVVDDGGKELPAEEPGELLVRGAAESSGYYNDPEETKNAWGTLDKVGWFRTGDIATLDPSGNLRIVGRKKDMIKRGGQNIFPKEIEDILRKHPFVLDVAIIDMPDPVMGEKACAYVVLKPKQRLSLEEVISFLKGEALSPYALPERLEIVESIPRIDYSGKVDKKILRFDITEKLRVEGKI